MKILVVCAFVGTVVFMFMAVFVGYKSMNDTGKDTASAGNGIQRAAN
ncbi:MAG: hypothetical protein ACI9CF_001424 [Candidatus Omnitrophota bacterium]